MPRKYRIPIKTTLPTGRNSIPGSGTGWATIATRNPSRNTSYRNEESFQKYEFFFNWYLPWAWRPKSGWILASRLDFTGAALSAAGTTGFLGSVGPTLAVRKTGWIVGVDLGISPAFLSHDRYGDEDLSGHIQFLTHGGVFLFPIRNLSIGYEYQHVSNADIQQPNPGLNMHNIEISYRIW